MPNPSPPSYNLLGCRTMKLCAATALACMAVLPLARAQSGAPPDPQATAPLDSQTATLSAHSTLVLVPALVRTKAGQLVFTLTANDFVLTDDGVPQKLTLEQDTGGEPLALVVLIEGGGSGARELDKYRDLAPMLESVVGGVPHKVAVVGFDSSPVLVQDFTPDIDAATHGVQALIADDNGDKGAAILDSIGFSVDLLRKQPLEYRRAILLVSESNDRGSHTKLDDALRAISDTNTAIYSIGFASSKSEAGYEAEKFTDNQAGPAHGCMAKDHADAPDTSNNRGEQAFDCLARLAPPLLLAKMAFIAARDGLQKNIPETVARLTGGEYFKLTSAKSLERDLATISNHIPNRYILSFQPQSPHPGLHAISLKAPGYNFEVTARDSYWADTEGPPISPPPGQTK
jgi:VWFA-related protein